jgi:hypothetical protein
LIGEIIMMQPVLAVATVVPSFAVLIAIWIGVLVGFMLGAFWAGRAPDDDREAESAILPYDADLHLLMTCNGCGTVGARHIRLSELQDGTWTPMALGEPLSPLAPLVRH